MSIRQAKNFLLLSSLVLNSCIVIDSKPLGYRIKNCTDDTLLIDLSETKTLNDDIFGYAYVEDSMGTISDDTTTVFINRKQVNIYNYYRILPNAKSLGFYFQSDSDAYYLYTVKWRIVTSKSLEEIRSKRLYYMMVLTKEDFGRDRIFDYKPTDVRSY